MDFAFAPSVPFERPSAGYGSGYTSLGSLPGLVELEAPAPVPTTMGIQTSDIIGFTQSGKLFVHRGSDVQAGDRLTWQARKYVVMGTRQWDQVHPSTGHDFGWMLFGIQVDPTQLIADLLAVRGQQFTLVPLVPTDKPSGGKDYGDGAARAQQAFVLFNTKGLDGREDSQTDRDVSRKLQFQLVGAADAVIAIGDHWEDSVAKYTVEEVDRTKPYTVEALVTGFLKVEGHGFG